MGFSDWNHPKEGANGTIKRSYEYLRDEIDLHLRVEKRMKNAKAARRGESDGGAFAAKGNAKEIKKEFRKSKHQLKTLCVKAIEKDGQGKSLDDWMADVEKMCGSFKLIAETQPIIDKMGGAAAMEDDSKLAADAPATMAAAVEAARPNF